MKHRFVSLLRLDSFCETQIRVPPSSRAPGAGGERPPLLRNPSVKREREGLFVDRRTPSTPESLTRTKERRNTSINPKVRTLGKWVKETQE